MPVERNAIENATYSAAVAVSGAGRTVYVSGMISPGGSLGEQTGRVLDLIEAELRRLGGSLADVVRITAYLTSLDEYGEYARIRGERFGGGPPASAAVQVAGLLQGALVEIDAVAFLAE